MADPIEFAQAKAWASVVFPARGQQPWEYQRLEAEENNDAALREDLVEQWRNRDDMDLEPTTQRLAEIRQAEAWLALSSPPGGRYDELAEARRHAATDADREADDDQLLSLWHATFDFDAVRSNELRGQLEQFDAAINAARGVRTARLELAHSWLEATDPLDHHQCAEDDQRLVQRWLEATGGKGLAGQMWSDDAELAQAKAWHNITRTDPAHTVHRINHAEKIGDTATFDQLREDLVEQWRNRDQWSDRPFPGVDLAQAKAWLAVMDPDAMEKWWSVHELAEPQVEPQQDENQLIDLWRAGTAGEDYESEKARFDEAVEAASSVRVPRAQQAEFAQAKAWASVVFPARGQQTWDYQRLEAEENNDAALREDLVEQWRNRHDDALPELDQETQDESGFQQARAWLAVMSPEAVKAWVDTNRLAVTSDEVTADKRELVEMWGEIHEEQQDPQFFPMFYSDYARYVDETHRERKKRLEQAEDWLKSTDSTAWNQHQQSRGLAATAEDEAGEGRRLVQRWLTETGGEVTAEQLRAETAALTQAEQNLRQRVTQRVRGWVSPPPDQATTAERGAGLEL